MMLVLAGIVTTVAQRTITGMVTDDTGEPLIGAAILVKATSSGTVTDIDGTYSLTLPEGATTLVFSYTGFQTQEITIGTSDVIDVVMPIDVIGLEDVVGIG